MPKSKHSVSVDIAVKSKMASHARFLANVSVSAAKRLRNTYYSALKSLEVNPERCPIYYPNSDIKEELRFLLFSKKYRIVFEIVDKEVYVYDVQDARQDTDKNLI